MNGLSIKQLLFIYGFAVFLLSVKVFADYKFPVGLNEEQKSAWTSILNTFLPSSGGSVTGNVVIGGTLSVSNSFRAYGQGRVSGTMTLDTNVNLQAVSDINVFPSVNGGAVQFYRYVDGIGAIALGDFSTNTPKQARIYYKTGSQLLFVSSDGTTTSTKFTFNDVSANFTGELHAPYFFSDTYEAESSGSYMAFDGAGNIYFYSGVGVQFDTAYAYFFGTVQMGQAQNLAGEGLTLEQFYDGGITNYIQNTVKHWRGIGVVAGGAGITTVNPKLNGTNIFTTIVGTPIATLSSSGTTLASMGFTKYIDGSMVNGTNFQFLSSVNGALAPNGTTNSIDILGY